MDAGGNGCDVCRARASSPEVISADDVENSALRRYYYFGVAYYDVPRRVIVLCCTTAGVPDDGVSFLLRRLLQFFQM